jgi:DNA-directed RNA polymerase subunit RPC12/RpoP
MSFEGYLEYKCECGKIFEGFSVYESSQITVCPCGIKFIKERVVDITNEDHLVRGDWTELE